MPRIKPWCLWQKTSGSRKNGTWLWRSWLRNGRKKSAGKVLVKRMTGTVLCLQHRISRRYFPPFSCETCVSAWFCWFDLSLALLPVWGLACHCEAQRSRLFQVSNGGEPALPDGVVSHLGKSGCVQRPAVSYNTAAERPSLWPLGWVFLLGARPVGTKWSGWSLDGSKRSRWLQIRWFSLFHLAPMAPWACPSLCPSSSSEHSRGSSRSCEGNARSAHFQRLTNLHQSLSDSGVTALPTQTQGQAGKCEITGSTCDPAHQKTRKSNSQGVPQTRICPEAYFALQSS